MVIDQSPDPGEWTSARQVRVVVSTGPANVKVPDIKGKPWTVVKKVLDDAGFVVPKPVESSIPVRANPKIAFVVFAERQ